MRHRCLENARKLTGKTPSHNRRGSRQPEGHLSCQYLASSRHLIIMCFLPSPSGVTAGGRAHVLGRGHVGKEDITHSTREPSACSREPPPLTVSSVLGSAHEGDRPEDTENPCPSLEGSSDGRLT